jgi:hypothetical protein
MLYTDGLTLMCQLEDSRTLDMEFSLGSWMEMGNGANDTLIKDLISRIQWLKLILNISIYVLTSHQRGTHWHVIALGCVPFSNPSHAKFFPPSFTPGSRTELTTKF